MLTSEILFEKIKQFEGCKLEAYKDAAGVPTIGYGHTYHVRMGDKISQYYAEDMLRRDIEQAERQVLALGVCKTQGQLDALTDFVFNLGISKLQRSTLLSRARSYVEHPNEYLEEEWKTAIRYEFGRWVYAGGKRLNGLCRRRNWEARRFFAKTPSLSGLELENVK